VSKIEKQVLKFATCEKLEEYLKKYFEEINNVDELQIFAHQINDYRYDGINDPTKKLNRILESGLMANDYYTTEGTMICLGSSKDKEIVKKIIDYDYHRVHGKDCRQYPTLILAFPKRVKVNGQEVEFASSKYSRNVPDGLTNLTQLMESKAKTRITVHRQYTPCTWLDVVYQSRYSPKDNLLAVEVNEKGVIADYNCDLEKALVARAEDIQCMLNDYLNEP